MMEWDNLMNSRFFITDLGAEQTAVIKDESVTIGRYAVWSPVKDNGKRHIIVEVGNDIERLKKKYSVSDERVCRLA